MKEKDRSQVVKILLAIIYPFGAFLYSWKDLKARSTYWAFFIFFIVYGLSFSPTFEAADSSRYAVDLSFFSSNPEIQYSLVLNEYFSKNSEIKDIFVYTLYYLVSVFAGGNVHVFFALVAIVFSYFFLRSFTFITDDDDFRNTPFFLILALIFFLSNPIFNINGVRFWTAAWIAVYAVFQIMLKQNRLCLLLLIILPLIHGSYYIFWVFFLIAYFVRHFHKILPYLFFISFFFTDIALQIIPDFSDYLPPFLQIMVFNYTESNEALTRMSGKEIVQEALYARILMRLPSYFYIVMIYLLVRSKNYFKDDVSKDLLGFTLGYGSLVNVSRMIPSMGRYWYPIIPLLVYLWVHNSHIMIRYKKFILCYLVITLYPTFRLVRMMFWTSDPMLYISNTFHLVFKALHNG